MRAMLRPAGFRLALGAIAGLVYTSLFVSVKALPGADQPLAKALLLELEPLLATVLLINIGRMRWHVLSCVLLVEGTTFAAIVAHTVDQGRWSGFMMGELSSVMTCLLLFIVQVVAFSAERDRRFFPHYHSLFEIAWEQGLLLVFSMIFVGIAWSILGLMALLFSLIGFKLFGALLTNIYVAPTITSLAFAGAIALCIDRGDMVRGARTLLLSLLSALLPVLAGLSAVFLVGLLVFEYSHGSLPSNLEWPLSGVAVTLIVLLNALYRDGRHADPAPRAMQMIGRIASVLILPICLLVLMPLCGRIHHYGWTSERVLAVALLGILLGYGAGYMIAALKPEPWLARVAPTNVGVACFTAVVFLTLLTPICDPQRIAVADQVSRLRDGRVSIEAFDFRWMARSGNRYGETALAHLAEGWPPEQAAAISQRIRLVSMNRGSEPPVRHVVMHPAGAPVPAGLVDFLLKTPPSGFVSALRGEGSDVDVGLLDNGDASHRIVVLEQKFSPSVLLLVNDSGQGWHAIGRAVLSPNRCAAERMALLRGEAFFGSVTLQALRISTTSVPLEKMDTPSRCGVP